MQVGRVRSPQSITTYFGCGAEQMGKNYLLSSLTAGMGGPVPPHLGVHMCERDSGCLVPGA